MADERQDQNPTKDLESVEATELDDKDLEDASGGLAEQQGNNLNCGC